MRTLVVGTMELYTLLSGKAGTRYKGRVFSYLQKQQSKPWLLQVMLEHHEKKLYPGRGCDPVTFYEADARTRSFKRRLRAKFFSIGLNVVNRVPKLTKIKLRVPPINWVFSCAFQQASSIFVSVSTYPRFILPNLGDDERNLFLSNLADIWKRDVSCLNLEPFFFNSRERPMRLWRVTTFFVDS